jgi:hypothetical protein
MRKGLVVLGVCFIVAMVLVFDPWGWNKCHVNWSNVFGNYSPLHAEVNPSP